LISFYFKGWISSLPQETDLAPSPLPPNSASKNGLFAYLSVLF